MKYSFVKSVKVEMIPTLHDSPVAEEATHHFTIQYLGWLRKLLGAEKLNIWCDENDWEYACKAELVCVQGSLLRDPVPPEIERQGDSPIGLLIWTTDAGEEGSVYYRSFFPSLKTYVLE